jgi:nuclear pore complex protein Nup205
MEAVSSLRAQLVAAVGGAVIENEQGLFDQLTVNRARLQNVLDFGPRSANELREIQQGEHRVRIQVKKS